MTTTQATGEAVERVESQLPEAVSATATSVVRATFYGVLGARPAYSTSSGVEALVGCHALNCYR